MSADIVLRSATPSDAEACLAIYAPYVRDMAVSFEIDPPSLEEFTARITRTLKRYPYIVAELGGEVVGYTYAGPFRPRPCYDCSAETSIYVNSSVHRKGIGKTLYQALEKAVAGQGITNLYACIAYPRVDDDPYLTYDSVRFHERLGYVEVGHFHSCARKFGREYDMIWMEKHLS
jgi:phosphinothricin acetyltransferase